MDTYSLNNVSHCTTMNISIHMYRNS